MIAQSGNAPALMTGVFFLAWAQPITDLAEAHQFHPSPLSFGDLSPPRPLDSLLSLHCALTL